MAFPTSPTNGQVYIKDGIRYVYASASNSWTIQADPNKSAGNIKSGVEIDTITGTFPSDGTAGVGDVLSGKTFYTDNATKKTGTLSLIDIDKIYVTSKDAPLRWSYKDGTNTLQTTYAFVSGNYIYCPVVIYLQEDFSNTRLHFYLLILSTDSSDFPVRTGIPSDFIGVGFTSIYLDGGVIYFNLNNNYYYTYTISTDTWSSYISGQYTSGTHINSTLTLNGLKYEPSYLAGANPSGSGPSEGLWMPLCKITKA